MYQTSTTTLQFFIGTGGLNVLVEFLEEDFDTERELVVIGVNGVWSVFELQVRVVCGPPVLLLNKPFRGLFRRMTSAAYFQGARSYIRYL